MRLIVLVVCGLALQISCFAQPENSVSNVRKALSEDVRFSSFVATLKTKNISNRKLVRTLFSKAHRDYLKNYVAYSQVEDVFKKGNYDCLSGTYFLACALEALNIPFKIYETNYHIFLTVQTMRGEILMESTDRINGLVQNRKAVAERIAFYQETKSTSPSSELYLSRIKIFHELSSQQLPGLLFYNQAVVSFNKKDFRSCCQYLEQAWKIYDHQRIEIFAPILLTAIEGSQMEKSEKEQLANLIRTHLQTSLFATTIASR